MTADVAWLVVLAGAALGMCAEAAEPAGGAPVNAEEQEYLLALARQTLCWHLRHRTLPKPEESGLGTNLLQKLGCFVTLEHKQRGLRGCIGVFERTQPLYRNVISRAIAAANDPRPGLGNLAYDELRDIRFEVSVLTAPRELVCASPADLLARLRPNVDGVILHTPWGASTYLPQVWEHFARKEDFLTHLCEKGGAAGDTWQRDFARVRVETYQALVFHETNTARRVVGPRGAVAGPRGATVLGEVAPGRTGAGRAPAVVPEGTALPAGTIVAWDADTVEKR